MEFTAKIMDPLGLHARPAASIVKVANTFESDATISCCGKSGNLKSIMSVMGMAIKNGSEVTIKVEGSDEEASLEAIKTVMSEEKII